MPTKPSVRVFTESIAIVVSILLAFAIDATWDVRVEQQEAGTRIGAVADELGDALAGFEAHLRTLDQQEILAREILGEMAESSVGPARMDSLLFSLGPFPEYLPPQVAYRDAEGAGAISLLESAPARLALGEYRSALELDLAEQRSARSHFDLEIAPLWSEYVNVADHVAHGTSADPGLMPQDLPGLPFRSDYDGLMSDRRFANQIVSRLISNSRVRYMHRQVIERINRALALVDSN